MGYRSLLVALIAAMSAGCSPELTPAEQFVRAQLPGDIRGVFYSADGNVICGEIGDEKTGKFRRFFSYWKQKKIAYEGAETFSLWSYAEACEMSWTHEQIMREEARPTPEVEAAEAAKVERQRARREKWLHENGDAIRALHEAANQADTRSTEK